MWFCCRCSHKGCSLGVTQCFHVIQRPQQNECQNERTGLISINWWTFLRSLWQRIHEATVMSFFHTHREHRGLDLAEISCRYLRHKENSNGNSAINDALRFPHGSAHFPAHGFLILWRFMYSLTPVFVVFQSLYFRINVAQIIWVILKIKGGNFKPGRIK